MPTHLQETEQSYIHYGRLEVAEPLARFVRDELAVGTGVDLDTFWREFDRLLEDFAPRNRALLLRREELQIQIDGWHQEHQGTLFDADAYRKFLENIGYLLPEPNDFTIKTGPVDAEIASIAGPQLVVPVMNARYALNAANARWGSLYDALYGSDVMQDTDHGVRGEQKTSAYDPVRGAKVIEFGRGFLNQALPLATGCHKDVTAYQINNGKLLATLAVTQTSASQPLKNSQQNRFNNSINHQLQVALLHTEKLIAYTGKAEAPDSILLKNNGLHIEILIDPASAIGKQDKAGIKDIVLEAALTTIQDCEDSVAAVDAEDKVVVYRNWLGLMRGNLQEIVVKNGREISRTLAEDRVYTKPDGAEIRLPGRSLLLIRNVGLLMTNNAVLHDNGKEIPEGILDGVFTVFAALHDLRGPGARINSRTGSIYIVKPKMHGPEEVAFSCALFDRIEDLFGLSRNTLKIGIMDEERRTTVNLKACIKAAQERIIFINTGFLDRTGDEIHTSMAAGEMVRKAQMKQQAWLTAYEDRNIDIGLACGLPGKAQIGKGMWAKPDEMAAMMREKSEHLLAGASCAWVPSPTAATLHAMHYHQIDVAAVQMQLSKRSKTALDKVLVLPLAQDVNWSKEEIQLELDNNAQSLLGYVVRWVEQGIGCSKVPDIDDVALMEDRATLRISSQHMANWLRHGVCSAEQVHETLQRMAAVVDRQNAGDPLYRPMAVDFEQSIAYQAACDLVFKGCEQPSGYTEPILHARRIEYKQLER